MPAALDLTNQRFGLLTVLRRNGRARFGRDMAAWLCRCDCGAEVTVPQVRLTTKSTRHQYHACDDCGTHPCVICGFPIPDSSAKRRCSAECEAEWSRQYQREYYHRVRALDPDDIANRRRAEQRRRAAMTPEEKLAARRAQYAKQDPEVRNARARAYYERRMADPEYAAQRRLKQERYRLENLEQARAYSREHRRRERAARAETDMLRIADLATEPTTEPSDDQ